jgi:hypothetical protein
LQGVADEIPHRQRRVRYKGTHPRHYAERYKELDPERHAQELDKVRGRGDTPAGTHRPICVQEIPWSCSGRKRACARWASARTSWWSGA